MSQTTTEPVEIGYATPAPRSSARVFAASMILIGGIALVVLGGCFLIGVQMTIEHVWFNGASNQLPLTRAEMVFVAVLSLLCAGSIAGAVTLLIVGTRALLRVIRM